MIKAQLVSLSWVTKCNGLNCKKSNKYFSGFNYIKLDILRLEIHMGMEVEYYCLDCVDDIYFILKPLLDKKLWAFK